jgi:hypothetical protein
MGGAVMSRYLSTDPNAGLPSKPVQYLSNDPNAGLEDEMPGAVSRFASGVGRGIVGGIEGLAGAVMHPIETATEMVVQPVRQVGKAIDAAREGSYLRAAADLGGAVPLVGGMALDLGERTAETGDYAGAAGEIVGNIALGKGLQKAPKAIKKGAPMARDAAKVMGREAASALPAAASAEVIASSVPGVPGGVTAGAVLTYKALKAIPKAYAAVKAGIMERAGVSGAAAEKAMIDMAPEKLAETARTVAPKEYDAAFRSHSPAISPERSAVKAKNSARIESERQAYWERRNAAEAEAAAKPVEAPARPVAEEPAPATVETAPEPVAAPEAPRGANPNIVDGEGRPLADWSPEKAREAVANLPWNKAKEAKKPAPVAPVESPAPAPVEPALKVAKSSKPIRVEYYDPEKMQNVRAFIRPEELEGKTFAAPKSVKEIAALKAEAKPAPEQAAPVEVLREVAEEAPKGQITVQPELADRIGKAVSPQAAFEDLKLHGAGDGKPIQAADARQMVDMVWKDFDPGYKSIEQWMMERRGKWDAMRQASPSTRSGNQGKGADLAEALGQDTRMKTKTVEVLHGTPDGISSFEAGRPAFFTDSESVARGYTNKRGMWTSAGKSPEVVKARVSFDNPLEIDAMGKRNDNIPVPWQEWKPKVFGNLPPSAVNMGKLVDYAKEKGHDAIVIRNVVDTASVEGKTKATVYVSLDPSKIEVLPKKKGKK